jgi:putative Mn2+ efflux pump MntP
MSTELLITSVLLGVGLAMDAFSVSIANGLADSGMKTGRMFSIAGTFAGFQFMMPMAGWLLVTEAARLFKWFSPLIPWIALILLLIIGGGLLKDGMEELRASKSGDTKETESADTVKLTFWALMMQGVATSIDALSVGFTTAAYNSMQALVSSLIIGVVTLFICLAGLRIGRRLGELLAGRASILGGLILIGIGLEIWIKGVFF